MSAQTVHSEFVMNVYEESLVSNSLWHPSYDNTTMALDSSPTDRPPSFAGKFNFFTFIVILTGATTGLLLGYDNGAPDLLLILIPRPALSCLNAISP